MLSGEVLHIDETEVKLRTGKAYVWVFATAEEVVYLAWNDGIVVRLARSLWDENAFDRLPILGDALEEAGCADDVVLGHCRSGDPDTRSSWLVDLIVWGS
jgi:hypothetical protein